MREAQTPEVLDVAVSEESLRVELSDGRTLVVPTGWYPRLFHATQRERSVWQIIDKGQGIHWQELDEDVCLEGLLHGRGSSESQSSLQKWLASRSANSEKR
ncbi:MAG: DUF2442 domain-containing protein [Gammaproteobacteria bacterium]|nr:DUF2442 domain-containing protein [Gammaproteobacteria bacterium]